MKIQNVTDVSFRKYGQVLKGYDFSELIAAMSSTPLPDDVVYEPSIKELEALPIYNVLSEVGYGESPIQIGYCNGHNTKLNAVEYHRSSEINVAVTDLILLLGKQEDIEPDHTYDTSKIEAYLLPAGMAVELYATTLHYAPCNANDGGFKDVIVLPKGTNYPLEKQHNGENDDKLLAAVNKWLIGHAEGGLPQGSFIGLKGENVSV